MNRLSLRLAFQVFFGLFLAVPAPAGEAEIGPPAPPQAKQTSSKKQKMPADIPGIAGRIRAIQARYNQLGQEFQKASPQKQLQIRMEAQKLQSEADVLVEKAAGLIEAAFQKDPKDKDVDFLLPYVLQQYLVKHKFGTVVTLARKVKDKNSSIAGVGEVLGLALFADNKFTEASKIFEEEAKAKRLSRRGEYFRKTAKEYMKLWEKETALRKEEEKADDLPRVKLETTRGTIVLELFENQAPKTVGNFVSLVEKGFYDGTAFHRVIPLFMAQGGDPNSKDNNPFNDGMGGPGYTIPCECYRPDHRNHFAGSLSMAHSGRDTGGSQFFITHVPTPHLNGKHTVFGRVIEGLDVVRSLKKGDKIKKAVMLRKRNHPYAPPPDAKKKKPVPFPPKKK